MGPTPRDTHEMKVVRLSYKTDKKTWAKVILLHGGIEVLGMIKANNVHVKSVSFTTITNEPTQLLRDDQLRKNRRCIIVHFMHYN